MKTQELLPNTAGIADKIAQQIVHTALKDFVQEDVQPAVERALARFNINLRNAVQRELAFRRITKI